jgi:DNA-binding NarL/FixJ family response regulator
MKHSIAIVDDHVLIAKALANILDNFKQFEVLYECENGQQLIERMQHKNNLPQIVLLDISMPIMNGFETAAWLKQNHPSIYIVALSMQDDDNSIIQMIRAGACAYLHKNVHPTELENALNTVVQSGIYYPNWVAQKIIGNIANGNAEKAAGVVLSDRENEFLSYACTDLTYKEIGEKMHCSPRTVEGYRDGLFEKLEVKSRVALALYAVKVGLVSL